MSKKKDKKKTGAGARQERRFIPQSATNPWLVRALGAVGALLLGAGIYGYLYAQSFAEDDKLRMLPSYLIAGSAVVIGVVIWIGTSSEAPVRVGSPGIAVERGEVRRMPWWAVDKISWQSGALALLVTGRDEAGADWTFKVPVGSHPEAVGWILREAEDRIPKKIDIDDEVRARMPAAAEHAGMKLDLEPLQIVGKKCVVTGKTISYEPDGRVCPRCERVYFKTAVPNKCKCGASIASLRPAGATAQGGSAAADDTPEHTSDDEAEGSSTSERAVRRTEDADT